MEHLRRIVTHSAGTLVCFGCKWSVHLAESIIIFIPTAFNWNEFSIAIIFCLLKTTTNIKTRGGGLIFTSLTTNWQITLTYIYSTCHFEKNICSIYCYRIGVVMASVLVVSTVDSGFEPRSGQTKDYKLVWVASPLSTQHLGKRAKAGWLGIR